jgi:hypothetical protein
MKTNIPLAIAAVTVIGLAACEDRSAPTPAKPAPTTTPAPAPAPKAVPPATPAPETAPEIKATEADLKIATEIRRLITEDKAMSTGAQECKIAVMQGVVTLTGLVDTRAEKDSIEAKAKGVDGVTRVDNRLEVKPPK